MSVYLITVCLCLLNFGFLIEASLNWFQVQIGEFFIWQQHEASAFALQKLFLYVDFLLGNILLQI